MPKDDEQTLEKFIKSTKDLCLVSAQQSLYKVSSVTIGGYASINIAVDFGRATRK